MDARFCREYLVSDAIIRTHLVQPSAITIAIASMLQRCSNALIVVCHLADVTAELLILHTHRSFVLFWRRIEMS